MISGYGLKVTSAATGTDMDRGSARRRRTATKSKTVLDFSVALTDEQYAIFAAWWRYDLYDGTLPTTMKILNGYADDPATVQFLKPYTATDQLGKWYVSCQVEIEPFRLSEAELDEMLSEGTIYTLPPKEPGGPGIFPFYGYLRITQHPVSQSVLQPDSATFTIAAVGTGILAYQWKKNGVNVGTNSTTYNTGATTWTGTDDVIACTVSNGVTSLTSSNATLNVRKVTIEILPTFPANMSGGGGVLGSDGYVYLIGGASLANPMFRGVPENGGWTNSGVPQPSITNNNGCISRGAYFGSYMAFVMATSANGQPRVDRFNKDTLTWDTLCLITDYMPPGNSENNRYVICYDDNGDVIVWWQAWYTTAVLIRSRILKYSGGAWTTVHNYGTGTQPSIKLPNIDGTGFMIKIGGYYYVGANTAVLDPSANVRIWKIDAATWAVTDTGIACGGSAGGILVNNKILCANGAGGGGQYFLFDGSTKTDIATVPSGSTPSAFQMTVGVGCVYNTRGASAAVDKINL